MRPPPLSEDAFQTRVIDAAHRHHWLVHHSRPARKVDGSWSTPVQGDKGFPDLVLARDGEIIIAELKSDTGRLSTEQREWMAALGDAVTVCVWRPRDWDDVLARLSTPRRVAA